MSHSNTNDHYFFSQSDDAFKKFLLVSVALHFSVLIFLTVRGILLSSEVLEIPNAIRVDMVALPDKLPEDISPVPPKSEPAKAQPEPKKEIVKDVKATQQKALDKLKAMAAVEKMKNEVAAQSVKKVISAQPKPAFKGNIISSGNSFSGLSRLRVNEYLESLTLSVREHWVLPQWLSNANLKAAIVMVIDERGYVIKKEIHTSSGNSVFDSGCLAAVNNASPFAPPPDEVREAQIMIRFPFE